MIDGFRPLVDMAKVFRQFDTDDSGALSLDELTKALACLGLKDKAPELLGEIRH
jgi:Ca2+-binding EF-hand superfamily protein